MTLSKFEHVKISGISTVVPPKEINIYDEAQYYDNNIKKIDRMRKMVGFYKRRVVDKDVTPSDLSIEAAKNLINDMKIDKNTIDALIYVVQKPDFMAPATSFYIHNKLGLSEECAVFDVNQGCPGWIYGLWIASQMIESKTNKRILLLAGDTPSAGMDPKDRISTPVFGDGGTATLLEYSEEKTLSWYNITTHSKDYEAIMTPASGQRCRFALDNKEDAELFDYIIKNPVQTPFGHKTTVFNGYMDGIAVFNFTISEVPKDIKKLMAYANKEEKDIDALCLHQANKQIVQAVADGAGFPYEKTPYHAFETYGNNTMCSVPTTINSVLKEKIENDKATLCCSGYGNGLACASVIFSVEKIYSSGIRDYVKPNDFMSKKEFVEYWNKKLKGENKDE